MSDEPNPYQEGKRAGIHPLIVVFGILFGLWLFVFLIVPSSKNKQATGTEGPAGPIIEDPEAAPVLFKVQAAVSDMNAISLTVPPEATDSQVAGLLKRFKQDRLAGTLTDLLPATTPGHKLGDHAVADIYIVSDAQYAQADVIRTLTRGAHAPGNLYPQAVPFEVAMEAIRGHYRIDLNDTGNPDSASLGFADESGVHSRSIEKSSNRTGARKARRAKQVKRDGDLLCPRRAFLACLARHASAAHLQSNPRFNFCPQRLLLFNRPGIESCEQMSQWSREGSHDGIATLRQHAVSLGDADFFVRDMPRQAFRNHELLAGCPCDGSKNLATEHIQLLWNGYLHAYSLGGRPGRPLDRIVIGKHLLARFAVGSSHIRNLHPGHPSQSPAGRRKTSVYTQTPFESCIAVPCQRSRRMLKLRLVQLVPHLDVASES